MLELTNNKGIKQLKIDMSWRYRDNTVMHMAIAKGLLAFQVLNIKGFLNLLLLSIKIAVEYKKCAK